jgi:Ca-activated chloride channel family protein
MGGTRMKQSSLALVAVAFICLAAGFAQFRSDVRLVVVHATVTDKRGNVVSGLPPDVVHVFENGRPQTLKKVVQEDIPVTLGLLIDDSGSMRRLRPLVTEAARKMVDRLNPDDEVFMARFSMYLNIDVPPTTGPADLQRAVAGLARRNGSAQGQPGTDFYDCLQKALGYIEKTAQRDKTALLVITDGSDTASLLSLKQLIADIGHRESLIYAVGLPSRNNKRGRVALQQITETSGGRAFFPSDASELPGIAVQIAEEMRIQYTLTYRPDIQDLDGAYRAINVRVDKPPNSGGFVVRARKGYYAGGGKNRR